MRISIIVSLFILLISCATTNYYNHTIDSWRGSKGRDLIASWGQPSQIIKLADGTQTFTYVTRSPFGFGNAYQNQVFVVNKQGKTIGAQVPSYQPQPNPLVCTTTFFLNKQEVITRANFIGAECRGAASKSLQQ